MKVYGDGIYAHVFGKSEQPIYDPKNKKLPSDLRRRKKGSYEPRMKKESHEEEGENE